MPKKQSTFFFITAIFFIFLSGLFISCKSELTDQAQLSFSVPQKMFRMATDFLEDEGEEEEDYEITFSVKLVDDSLKEIDSHEEKKKLSEWEAALDSDEDSYTVTFDKVAVGTELYAMVSLYASVDGKTIEFFNGNSEKIKVEEGSNTLSVKLKNVLPKVKLTFLFQESLGGSTYAENEKFPAITLDFLGQTDIEHMAAITKTIMAAYMAGYQVNEEKMPDSPELQKDGTYSLTLYFDLIGKTISGTGSISYNLDYLPFTVSIDKTRISVNGDTITISVRDNDGKLVTSGLDYGVALSYKGTELDNSEYLKFSEPVLTIEPLDIAGRYSLNIVVVQMKDGIVPIVGSQTFDISAVVNTELYVSADGDDGNDGLTAETAVPSIEAAGRIISECSFKSDELVDWTINVVGTLNEPQKLTTKSAKTVTIQGMSNAVINAHADENNNKTALTLTNCSPVILKDIKITGGYAEDGAGIKTTVALTIDDGVLIAGNHATNSGGGVYSNKTIVMKGGTITDNIPEYEGGGIYSDSEVFMCGEAVIGDKATNSPAVYDATNPENNSYGNLCLDSQNSSYSGGGGITCGNLYLGYSGKDENNNLIEAELRGGIYRNYAVRNGGGIYITYWRTMTMSSGNIAYNTTEGNGNGIWLTSRGGKLIVSGDAKVSDTNDVYLTREYSSGTWYEAYIEIAGELTQSNVATITPGDTAQYQVLYLAEGFTAISIADIKSKFTVSDGRSITDTGYLAE